MSNQLRFSARPIHATLAGQENRARSPAISAPSPLAAAARAPLPLAPDDYRHLSSYLGGFARYWEGRRGGRDIPDRSDIDVLDLKPWLGWLNMLDVIDGGRDFRYRVFGTHHVARLGADVTGKLASESTAAVRAHFTLFLGSIIATRRPVLTHVTQRNMATGHAYEWRRLGVPLTRGASTVDAVLVLAEAGDLKLVGSDLSPP